MKRLLILLSFILLFCQAEAQIIKAQPNHRAVAVAAPSNMISNGTFDSADGWYVGASWTIGSGVATFDNTAAGAVLKQANADMVTGIQGNKTYEVSFNFVGSGYMQFDSFGTGLSYKSVFSVSTGTITFQFTTPADVSGGGITISGYDGFGAFTIDNFRITEVV